MSEPAGCLTSVLRMIGIARAPVDDAGRGDDDLPFRLRDDFLSLAERAFYRVLVRAAADCATVLAKVNLADLLFVPRSEAFAQMNRINRKHVEFLLCRPDTMRSLCGVELEESSRARPSRQKRDDLVDRVFAAAGLHARPAKGERSYEVADPRSAPHR